MGSTDGLTLKPEEFRMLRDLIYEHCGIYLPESVSFLVERRLKPRLAVYNVRTFQDYYRKIRYGREARREIDEVMDRITTNETYFFRGENQLAAFTDEIMPRVLADRDPSHAIRIWSAGCSSGEEPYTLAMLLDDMMVAKGRKFEIVGNDISRHVIKTARAGIYRSASFRQTEDRYIERYFRKREGLYHINDHIKSMVSFGHLNLMDESTAAMMSVVDIVFCLTQWVTM